MNHIFYQTKTYYTNTGDALINQALIQKLREYGTLHANCGREIPTNFLEELGIHEEEKVVSDSEMSFIYQVLSCAVRSKRSGDRVYVVSGLGDMYGGGMRLVVRNFASGLIFPVFRLFGVRIVRIGRSVGPLSKLMEISEWIRSLFLSSYYVRDSRSLKRCRDMGINKAKMCPDMSWLYDEGHEETVNQTQTVMVNLRNAIFDEVEPEFVEATLSQCEKVLKRLNDLLKGRMKVCVAYQIQEDEAFSQKVFERLKEKYPVQYVDHQMRLSELEHYYGSVDYHISNRMHSLLAGYKYGSLPIALIDTKRHAKIAATFEDCQLEEVMVDIYGSDILERLDQLAANRTGIMRKLFLCEQKNQTEISAVLDSIFGKKQRKN